MAEKIKNMNFVPDFNEDKYTLDYKHFKAGKEKNINANIKNIHTNKKIFI